MVLALGADYLDFELIKALGGNLAGYQNLDKLLDLYYLCLAAYTANTWDNLKIKKLALALFLLRFIGTLLFEVTQIRAYLFFFPNLFEVLFLLYLTFLKVAGENFLTSRKKTAVFWSLFFLFSLVKLYQEYSLHLIDQHPWPGSQILGLS